MAARKYSKKRGGHRWFGYLLSFLFGSALGLLIYHSLIGERSLSKEAFSQKAPLIDEIIQSRFYEIGITPKDVLLRQSLPKGEDELSCKLSLIKIELPRELPFSLIEEKFRQGLGRLGGSVSLHSTVGKDSLTLDITVRRRLTHQLVFLHPKASWSKIESRPKVAIVIDDLGDESKLSRELLEMDVPITLSILPFSLHGRLLAEQAKKRGKEVILHLPMEPHGGSKADRDQGTLLRDMDEQEFRRELLKDLGAVPHIKGVSNHKGSRLMEDPAKVRIVMKELKRRGLFFLDSRTTPGSVGLKVAQSVGVRALERTLFLDHAQDPQEIRRQLERLASFSLERGRAIGIGHPHPATLASLKEMIPLMKERGIEIVPLSCLLE